MYRPLAVGAVTIYSSTRTVIWVHAPGIFFQPMPASVSSLYYGSHTHAMSLSWTYHSIFGVSVRSRFQIRDSRYPGSGGGRTIDRAAPITKRDFRFSRALGAVDLAHLFGLDTSAGTAIFNSRIFYWIPDCPFRHVSES